MKSMSITPRYEGWFSALLVVIVTSLTYGPLISRLGYYRDDWYLIWTAQSQGTEGILNLFKGDRPLLGWLYVFDYNLLGNAPLNWHIYALLIKIVSALAFLWLLRSLWQNKKIETTLITLLFVVYPGFYQQPNAATFKNLLLAYAAAMFSLAFTIQVLRAKTARRKLSLTILSLLLALFYIFIYEALIGVEAVRLLLVWYFLNQPGSVNWKLTLRKTAFNSMPYLLFAAGFVFWRIFLFQSTRRATNVDVVLSQFGPFSLDSILRLGVETIKDLFETSILAWGVPYYQFSTSSSDYRVTTFAIALALVAIALAGAYIFLLRNQAQAGSEAERYPNDERDWFWLGAIIIIVTTLPIVLAGRNVIFSIQWDRYTYQSIAGVALFIGGFVFYAMRGRLRWVLLGILLISGIATQIFSANYYRKFWTVERNAMWQLSWRAPQIEDGTTLVLVLPGEYALAEEYEIWGPVNLVYHPNDSLRLPGQVMFDDLWLDLALGTREERVVRGTIVVPRDYSRVIILSQPSALSCLHVIDGKRSEQAVSERLDLQFIAKYSNVNFIDPSATAVIPSSVIFGSEPPHDWCYFYQKIDLARQEMDWQRAADLADEAISLGFEPRDVSEWFPALEAYIHTNDEKHVKRIALLIRVDKDTYHGICEQLKTLYDQPAEYDRDLLFDNLCKRD